LTFFTQRLSPSVGPFEAPVSWWARISDRQPLRCSERANLRHVVGETAGDGLVEQHGGGALIVVR